MWIKAYFFEIHVNLREESRSHTGDQLMFLHDKMFLKLWINLHFKFEKVKI